MDPLARYLFKPPEQVTRELSDLPEEERIDTVRRMLLFSKSTYEVAKQVMPSLGLDNRMDLLELACRPNPTFESHVKARIQAQKTDEKPWKLTCEIMDALKAFNVPRDSWGPFMRGVPVMYQLPTRTGHDTYGFLKLEEDRLAAGILSVHAPGEGLQVFADFRQKSDALARATGKPEVELIGAALINQRLGRILVQRGFQLSTTELPAEYGGGEMEILSKRFPVSEP